MKLSLFPSEWVFAPLDDFKTDDPTEERRWATPLNGGWSSVLAAVTTVLATARQRQKPVWHRIDVDIDSRNFTRAQEDALDSFFSAGCGPTVGFSKADGVSLIDGRHRTQAARQLSLPVAAVQDATFGDGLRAVDHDEAIWGPYDAEPLASLQAWWASDEAVPWRRANPGHERNIVELRQYWETRFDN